MPEYDDFQAMFEAAWQHVHETGHSVHCCDDPRALTIGYACSDCTTPDTIWSIELRFLRVTVDQSSSLWTSLRSQAGRERLADELNIESRQPSPISYSRSSAGIEEILEATLSPEEEVQQLEELWGASEAAGALAEQARRNIRARDEFEARVHSRLPTRFEREDVI